ncbi:WD40 repeat domain-containing protein [Zavarzinella formosa]|uniref:WD40 repeat domain-containing protein n=1 Tax=Zavarzinella formosa TaxID=360055 RepID=UPI0002F75E3E|nr:WD40 repeat domain-containing protein [Zavarzinella formosa]
MVTLWNIEKGTAIRSFLATRSGITSLAFSADGATLMIGTGQQQAMQAETASGRVLQQVAFGEGAVHSIGLVTGGKFGVGLVGETVRYWDIAAGKVGSPAKELPEEATALACSADGKIMAVADKTGGVRLWDLSGWKELRKLDGHKKAVRGLSFSADAKHLASMDEDGVAKVWETATGKETGWANAPPVKGPRVVGVSVGGRFVACAVPWEGRARVWEAATGKMAWPAIGHSGGMMAVAVSPDGLVSSAGQDGSLRRWEGAGSPLVVPFNVFARHAVAFSQDGQTAAWGGTDGRVHVVDWRTGKETLAFQAHKDGVAGMTFSPDGRRLATSSGEKTIRFWETATGKETGKIDEAGPATHLRFTGDGSELVWRQPNGGAFVASVKEGAKPADLPMPAGITALESAAISPDGRWIAGGSRTDGVLVWGHDRTKPPVNLTGPRGYVMSLAFSPDGRILAAGGWGTVHLFETATWQLMTRLDGGNGDTLTVAFSPTGRSLVAGGLNGWVGVYDLPGVARAGKPKIRAMSNAERDELWQALSGKDSAAAFRSHWALAESPEAVFPLVKEALKPTPLLDAKKVERLTANLNGAEFATREAAVKELADMGDGVLPALRKLLAAPPSAEAETRAKTVVQRLAEREASPEGMALGRRLALLEQLRTPAARTLLEELAAGEPAAGPTRFAKAALARLGGKPSSGP